MTWIEILAAIACVCLIGVLGVAALIWATGNTDDDGSP